MPQGGPDPGLRILSQRCTLDSSGSHHLFVPVGNGVVSDGLGLVS